MSVQSKNTVHVVFAITGLFHINFLITTLQHLELINRNEAQSLNPYCLPVSQPIHWQKPFTMVHFKATYKFIAGPLLSNTDSCKLGVNFSVNNYGKKCRNKLCRRQCLMVLLKKLKNVWSHNIITVVHEIFNTNLWCTSPWQSFVKWRTDLYIYVSILFL